MTKTGKASAAPSVLFADGRPIEGPVPGPTWVSDTFVKLYNTLLDSSVWLESGDTRLLWITMLCAADSNGVVRASVGGLAHRARIDRKACEKGLAVLCSPDDDSRSTEYEGRRIERIEGGWLILNHRKYRELRTESQLKAAARQKRHRELQALAEQSAQGKKP